MAGELIVKNGLRVSGSTIILGSISATSFTGSFSGSITNATSASFALSSSFSSTASFYGGSVVSASFASTSSFPWFQTSANIAYVGGNVGINTSSPSNQLTVNGAISSSNSSFSTGIGAIITGGGNPAIVQRLQRTTGGYAYSMFQGYADNLTSLTSSKILDYGAFGDMQSGTTPPSINYSYFGVGTSSAHDNTHLRIYNNANKSITIDGNLGINNTSPTARLHVRGGGTTSATTAFRVENANASASLVVSDDRQTRITSEGAALYVEGAGVSPFSQNIAEFWYSGNGNSIIIAQLSGQAGLTTSTNANLHLRPNGTGVTVFLQGKQVRYNNSNDNATFALQNNGATGQARLDFITGSTTIMSITGSGNVGIGTTTPSSKLEVNGGPGFASGNVARFTLGGVGGGTRGLTMYSDGSQFKLQVSDNVGGIGTWAFLNLNPDGGNVGIGTTTPSARLQVKGSGTTSSTTALRIENANTSASFVVRDDGRVGVGTASPTNTFEVNGSATISGSIVQRGPGIYLYDISGNGGGRIYGSYGYANGEILIRPLNGNPDNFVFSPSNGMSIGGFTIGGTTGSPPAYGLTVSGSVGIGTRVPTTQLDVSGSGRFTSNLTVTGSIIAASFTGSLSGSATNAVSASFATTASYWSGSILNATSASFASTASFYGGSVTSASFASTASRVNTLNQNVIITGSLAVGSAALGSSENTIAVGPPPAAGAGEGGQILLAAAGGAYTSASMLDTYQDQFRVLRGTNAGSDGFKFQVNLDSGQVQIPNYNSPTAFPGAPVNSLATDNNGNILTVQGYTGIVTINTMPPVNFDIQNGIIVNVF